MTTTNHRRPLIAGNWKMYKTAAETAAYVQSLKATLPAQPSVDVTIAPAFTALESAVKAAAGSPIKIAAQNVYWEKEGAFTGEISTSMLTSLGVTQVIIGHSERRQYFGETNDTVNQRLKAALAGGLQPIVCIGETLDQREARQTFQVLERQLTEGLSGLTPELTQPIVLAYEPVWAIGTGKTATPEIAQEAHHFIRRQLEKLFNKTVANSLLILYGGSVKPENAAVLMAQEDIDGALVGGASLKPEVFIEIINFK
jgi:triosephosphate isomerase